MRTRPGSTLLALHGLKESVIIGKLIPAGTGFRRRQEKRRALTEAAALAMAMHSLMDGVTDAEPEQDARVAAAVALAGGATAFTQSHEPTESREEPEPSASE